MRAIPARFLCPALLAATLFAGRVYADPDNPEIDMPGFLKVAGEAAEYRRSHRVTEDDFLRMSQEPGTIILDARSRDKYNLAHVKDALNLSFPDIDIESLKKYLPDHNARVLIYCNNNFAGDPEAFPSKRAPASLNISTYIALYTYGYRNVYELRPHLDVRTTKLPLVPTAPGAAAQ